jgi:alkanesulfonate monooxygenase SsuD/methylene tetrahydromethanopterin reductase-like flavin-dependent oxidoreductase (luciferase family)
MPAAQTSFRPALSIVATSGKRRAILDLAVEAERRGFAGLACPSLGGTMGLCVSLAHETTTIPFWTSIQPIYYSHPVESANTAAHINEMSGGRFRFGIGVSHGPVVQRLGVSTGKPLSDISDYVAAMKANERFGGALPPLWLATLRDKMLTLATDIADGAVWANASLSHMVAQLDRVPAARRDGFELWNMVPVVIDDDVDAARAVNRKTLTGYVSLPNYRNYWRAAGYQEEMDAIESALNAGDKDRVTSLMTDRWLDDSTISGSAGAVRDRLEEWSSTGVQPIAVMSSTSGGQAKAIGELFAAYDS